MRADPGGQTLRIGLVCPYSLDTPGGVQNHVIGLAGYLTRRGHRVAVLAPGRPDPATVRRHDLVPDQFTSAGRTVPVSYNGSVARVNFGPLARSRTRRWLRDGRFDLVHLHEPISPSVGLHALLAVDAPVVATFHTANPSSRTMRLAGRVLAEAVDRIDVRIAVSPTAARMVRDHLSRDSTVIPNGFTFSEFAEGRGRTVGERGRTGRAPRLVFLGRLTETRKGLDVLLDALPTIRAQHPDVEVLVAGQGRRRLPAPCRALGRVDDAARARLMASADVFVAPHVDRESFGLVLIEALAAGAPVVASDLPAFVDVLTAPSEPRSTAARVKPAEPPGRAGSTPDPMHGRVFPARDPGGLAHQVLASLAEDPGTRLQQRIRGRELTRQFDWSQVGPRIEGAYAQALGRAVGHVPVNTLTSPVMSAATP